MNSILCVGGYKTDSETLLLVSCGNCITVLSETKINHPIKNNGAYWYLTKTFSFGFSSKFLINQIDCDTYDCIGNKCQDSKRLCWHIGGLEGGYRLGTLIYNKKDFDYNKVIFLKH